MERIEFKREWHYSQADFFLLVSIVKELVNRNARLEEIVERQGNQIQNAFDIFSKEGEHY